MSSSAKEPRSLARHEPGSDLPFYCGLGILGGSYILLILAMLGADLYFYLSHQSRGRLMFSTAENYKAEIDQGQFPRQFYSLFAEALNPLETYLFTTDFNLQLNPGPVPPALKNAFANKEINLSDQSRLDADRDRLMLHDPVRNKLYVLRASSPGWEVYLAETVTIETLQEGSRWLLTVRESGNRYLMFFEDALFKVHEEPFRVFGNEYIRYSIKLSLISCFITSILSLWIAVPIAYVMSRASFPGKNLVDAILDIPIVLPPLVIGLSLLVLFRQTFLRELDDWLGISFNIPGVILAQFSVACAFAVRTLRATFDEIPTRREQVALTLGCSRSQAFWKIVLPEARTGLLTAGTMAWARSLGEFGPLLVFAGTARLRTEVLPVSVHLEISTGNIEGAVAVSMLMVSVAMIVLVVVRILGKGELVGRGLR